MQAIRENVSLADYSTMRLGGQARYLTEATQDNDVPELIKWAKDRNLPFIVIGRGSNIIWSDGDYPGLIIVDRIMGREVVAEDDASLSARLASGENWDKAVEWLVGKGLTGVEYLSLIPGTVGAAPVQNIGAYGGDLTDTLVGVEAFDTERNCFVGIPKDACGFAYRTSRFKGADKGRFIITSIVLKLQKGNPKPPFYEVLQDYLDEHKVAEFTPQTIREAVMSIRTSKMPDPEKVANNGSFFTNPFVDSEKFDRLKAQYPEIKGWPESDKVKLSAGWLVEQAGFKGVHDSETGMATSDKTALVLINEHARSTADLIKFKQKIVDKVQQMFGVTLEQEPELLP